MEPVLASYPVTNGGRFFDKHKVAIQEEYNDSIQTALQEEIGAYEDLSTGIDIITDARHGWRTNAYDTSV